MKKLKRMILVTVIGIILIAGFTIVLYVNIAPQFGASRKARQEFNEKSNNFKEGRFKNIESTPMYVENTSFFRIMKDFMKKDSSRIPGAEIETDSFDGTEFLNSNGKLKYVWFGHSTVLINIDNKIVLTDPVFSKRPSPVPFGGMTSFDYSKDYSVDVLPNIDYVLLSHDHYDHLDYETIRKLNQKVGKYLVPVGVAAHLYKWGVEESKVIELDWGQNVNLDINFVCTPARHFSGRRLLDRDKSLWCSWVIKGTSDAVFFSGDSGYGKHFKEIGNKHGPFDLTLMECGQYNESWPYIHMMPEEVVKAHIDLQGKKMLPIHWGKFSLSLHSWNEPIERLLEEAWNFNVDVCKVRIGAINGLSNKKVDINIGHEIFYEVTKE